MLEISVGSPEVAAKVLAVPVWTQGEGSAVLAGTVISADSAVTSAAADGPLAEELALFLAGLAQPATAGTVNSLPRPGRDPEHVLLFGVGQGTEADWRTAGAGLVRAASAHPTVTVRLPTDGFAHLSRALLASAGAEGAWLGSYRYRLGADTEQAPRLRRLVLAVDAADAPVVTAQLARARAVVDAVILARDLTNAPSLRKSPRWLAERVVTAAARRPGVTVTVHDEEDLRIGGFGGILAIGAGSARPPRLVEVAYRPRKPRLHVVLVGKGITFDSGGISIKPVEGMKLMRKDMAGAAAVCGAVLGAADLSLPVRVTAVAPMAENMISGAAVRPGDVVRHYGGLTTEVRNTDAEGRVVLGDAIAYAVRRLKPDLIIDLATLTGASHVALGKRTAALFTHDDELAAALCVAGDEVGERMWRLPLAEEYLAGVTSGIADLNNSPPGPGALTAALYLREFTGDLREKWAHIDMSGPSWIEKNEGPLVKGATGWGVRMLLRWLGTL